MIRRFRCSVEAKKEFVAEVLSGLRVDVVARRHGMHPNTLRIWVRQYRDEVDDIMAKKKQELEQIKQDAANYQELQKMYENAVKLLGERELEIQMLRELVKKIIPTGSGGEMDPKGLSGKNCLPDL